MESILTEYLQEWRAFVAEHLESNKDKYLRWSFILQLNSYITATCIHSMVIRPNTMSQKLLQDQNNAWDVPIKLSNRQHRSKEIFVNNITLPISVSRPEDPIEFSIRPAIDGKKSAIIIRLRKLFPTRKDNRIRYTSKRIIVYYGIFPRANSKSKKKLTI